MDGWKAEAGKSLETGTVHSLYIKKYGRKVFRLQVSQAPQIRVRIGKLFSLFLSQNVCCGYSKEPSQ